MREYGSCFALLIRDLIVYRKASGCWNGTSYGSSLRAFDRFYTMGYPDSVHLTQEMVDRWYRQRDSETSNSCRSRIYVVYSFIKYLLERGSSEVPSPRMPRKKCVTYIPYTFPGDEIHSSFKACDNPPDISKIGNILIRRITVLVPFRLLYSSDICTTGTRLLERVDMDAGNGILNIRYSKGYDQHYITLHDSTADLMRRYDSAIREWFPSQKYPFLAPGDTAHPHIWVEKSFRGVRAEVFNNRTAIVYAFRYHYAIVNINRWIGDRFAFDDRLTCLSKSVGHTTLRSTRYYYSIVPDLSDIVLRKTEDGLSELVPEVIS